MGKHKEADRLAAAVEALSAQPRAKDTSRETPDPKTPLGYRFRVRFFTSHSKSDAATVARRKFPIMAYVGPNGGGKSLAMIKDTLPTLAMGRNVLSTVRLLDSDTGQPHPGYTPFTDWDQLLDARDCDVLMDEMVGIAGARESAKLDVRVQNLLVQLRRRNVVLRWSAPAWLRSDKIVREVTQAVTECRGYYADTRHLTGNDPSTQLWAPKRLFSFMTYDTIDFEEWTAGRREKTAPQVSEWFNGVGSTVFKSYDTLDQVERVTGADEGGVCTTCGGAAPRRRPCSCARDAHGRHLPSIIEGASEGFPELDRAQGAPAPSTDERELLEFAQ